MRNSTIILSATCIIVGFIVSLNPRFQELSGTLVVIGLVALLVSMRGRA